MRRNFLKFQVVNINQIKTTYYQKGITPKITKELSCFMKAQLPLEYIVLDSRTKEIIANGHYYEAYKESGAKTVKVVLADIPREELIHAVFLHWKPVQSYVKLFPIMKMLLSYYNKKTNGPGSKYRTIKDGETLRAYIAELCGTNRTYFDYIIKVGEYDKKLLAGVDAGDYSLMDAVRMVPKKASSQENSTNKGKTGGTKVIPMNQDIHVRSASSLTTEERRLLCNALPKVLSDKLSAGKFPDGFQLDKRLSHNKELLNFHLHYELNNVMVSSEVIPLSASASAKAA